MEVNYAKPLKSSSSNAIAWGRQLPNDQMTTSIASLSTIVAKALLCNYVAIRPFGVGGRQQNYGHRQKSRHGACNQGSMAAAQQAPRHLVSALHIVPGQTPPVRSSAQPSRGSAPRGRLNREIQRSRRVALTCCAMRAAACERHLSRQISALIEQGLLSHCIFSQKKPTIKDLISVGRS